MLLWVPPTQQLLLKHCVDAVQGSPSIFLQAPEPSQRLFAGHAGSAVLGGSFWQLPLPHDLHVVHEDCWQHLKSTQWLLPHSPPLEHVVPSGLAQADVVVLQTCPPSQSPLLVQLILQLAPTQL